ncbi:MAG: GH92 family glycosyl hydrolase [Bacteroidota bacterium]
MKHLILILFAFLLMVTCSREKDVIKTDFTKYVNPLIGTSKMGHVYPGATAPFGMVQVSPQTNFVQLYDSGGRYNPEAYEYCAGYQYRDSMIIGFAHTSFSGTGHSDLGDLLMLPTTGKLNLEPLPDGKGNKGSGSSFSHERETASPGYYKVRLDSYNITAELTASERTGFHRYTFDDAGEAHVLLDMIYNVYQYDQKNVWTFIRVENDSLITGYRQTSGWARTRRVFFAIKFSKPFISYGYQRYDKPAYAGFYRRFDQYHDFPEMAGRDIRAYFNFDMASREELEVKVALSPVSTEGALKNMSAEIPHWDFDRTREEIKDRWNSELARIEVETLTGGDMVSFYTAMYHACLSPVIYEDVDGQYTGLDQNVHNSDGFTNYTVFSLWDTYRALHPLFNLIRPSRNNDMIRSMLAHYDQSVHHMLPVWSHYANENWCMIGYHAVSVLADAMVKGTGDFDRAHALEAAVSTSNVRYFDGLGDYLDYHYVPDDRSHSSVSKTLEYAYDDWCIAQIARMTGDTSVENSYLERSGWYMNVFDPASGFMRPRLADGSFRQEFDPLDTEGQGFIEGNAWNYGLYVPQDVERLIGLMGGPERFTAHLDSLFTMEIEDRYFEKTEDITRDGIIGNYVHGNEPGHHIAYLYNRAGHPEKTQEKVRMIMNRMYLPEVNGLCGNDDAGQMSAWYIFSSLGFYPVLPGSPDYELGSPLVKKAVIHLENGQTLTIRAENQDTGHVHVKRVILNGKILNGTLISHQELMKGGELVFEME